MKATSFKRIGRKIGAKMLMVVLSCALLFSSVTSFAISQIAEEDRLG